MHIDLGTLGLGEGGYLLVKRALREAGPGGSVIVAGTAPELDVDLRAWCRAEGHGFEPHMTTRANSGRATIVNGGAESGRWADARRVEAASAARADTVAEHPPRTWGL